MKRQIFTVIMMAILGLNLSACNIPGLSNSNDNLPETITDDLTEEDITIRQDIADENQEVADEPTDDTSIVSDENETAEEPDDNEEINARQEARDKYYVEWLKEYLRQAQMDQSELFSNVEDVLNIASGFAAYPPHLGASFAYIDIDGDGLNELLVDDAGPTDEWDRRFNIIYGEEGPHSGDELWDSMTGVNTDTHKIVTIDWSFSDTYYCYGYLDETGFVAEEKYRAVYYDENNWEEIIEPLYYSLDADGNSTLIDEETFNQNINRIYEGMEVPVYEINEDNIIKILGQKAWDSAGEFKLIK